MKKLMIIFVVVSLLLTLSAVAWSGVVSTDPGIIEYPELSTPLVEHNVESDDTIGLYPENQYVLLSSPLDVATGSPIPAGTAVCSYIAHFDPEGAYSGEENVHDVSGSITFDTPVLGLIFSDGTSVGNLLLTQSDPVVGITSMYDPAVYRRKLENPNTTAIWADQASFTASLVTLHLYANSGMDEVRIIVKGVREVAIDIKPGSDDNKNTIPLDSQGLIPVAILSTPDFNALEVNADTVKLAGANAEVRFQGKGAELMAHEIDVNGDGLMDLVIYIATANFDEGTVQDGEAVLTGETYDGQLIEGWDVVNIIPLEEGQE